MARNKRASVDRSKGSAKHRSEANLSDLGDLNNL